MQQPATLSVLAGCAALAAVACLGCGTDKPRTDPPAANASLPNGTAPAASATAASDRVWMAVENVGVVQLHNGELTAFIDDKLDAVRQLAVRPAGGIYALTPSRVLVVGADGRVTEADFSRELDAMSVARDGTLLIAHDDAVWRGSEGALSPVSEKLPKRSRLARLSVSPTGHAWVPAMNGRELQRLAPTPDARWETLEVGHGVSSIAFAPDGQVWGAGRRSLVRWSADDNDWQPVTEFRSMTRRRRVAVSSDGTVWATHGGGGLLIYRTDGLEKRMSKRNGTFPAAELGPWALDGAGRAWIATDDGLVVVQPNGELTHLKQGTIPHLSGRVRALIASGRPSLPKVAPERAVGSVRGRVTFDDADETGAPAKPEALTVHACGRIDWGGMGCPETKTWRRVAPVSADGAFEIAQVPVGPFALELFAGAERLQGSPRTSQRIARAGGVADVGTSSCSKRTSGTWWCRDLKPRASAATKRPGKKRTKRNKRVSQAPDGSFEVASDVLANVESRVRLVPHYRDGKQQGIKLVGVRPSSILRELSIRSGDVLLAMDGIPVGKLSSDELTAWLREAAGRERFSLSLTRGGLPIELTVLVRPPSVAPVSP